MTTSKRATTSAYVLLLALTFSMLALRPGHVRAQADDRYEIVATRNVMVAGRDGVRLATDVYVPGHGGTTPGRFPTVVERTPYNKDSAADQLPKYFVPRGYAVVLQGIRGRYRSEGKWRPIQDDGPDGADLLKWIAEQPWSNGKVGTAGTSYAGATQHAIGITNAPALAAMVPVDAMSNYGQFGIRHNGAFELRWLNWIFTLGNATGIRATATGLEETPNGALAAARAAASPESVLALQEMGVHIREYARSLPLRPGTTPLKFAPEYEAWLIEAMGHGDSDSYWANMGSSVVDHIAEYQDVPSYHVTGWYDSWGTQVANLNYVQLSKAKKSLQRVDRRPLDAWRPEPELRGHRRVRPADGLLVSDERSGALFFPTLHIHDGMLHEKANFDHIFYTQNEPRREAPPIAFWMPSRKAASRYLRVARTHGLVDGDAPCFQASLVGSWRNSDILVPI